MNENSESKINFLLCDKPSIGCRKLETPFVLVIKTGKGTFVAFQREGRQDTKFVVNNIFGENVWVDSIFDVEVSNKKHILVIVIGSHDTDGRTSKTYYTIGDKGEQSTYATAFFAYEADSGKAVHCISIIEEPGSKPVFTAALRFGKDNKRILKTQLRMYLALAGVNPEVRERIVTRGAFLQPPFSALGDEPDYE